MNLTDFTHPPTTSYGEHGTAPSTSHGPGKVDLWQTSPAPSTVAPSPWDPMSAHPNKDSYYAPPAYIEPHKDQYGQPIPEVESPQPAYTQPPKDQYGHLMAEVDNTPARPTVHNGQPVYELL
jgi:hypothetical protein